jgi:hypothetical protein
MRSEHGNRRAAYGPNGNGAWYVIRSEVDGSWSDHRPKLSVWETETVETETLARTIAADWIAGGAL